jgi:hypothetical protein
MHPMLALKNILALIVIFHSCYCTDYIADYGKYEKINVVPIDMHSSTTTLCKDPRATEGPHLASKMTIYINNVAAKMKDDDQEFPIGSIIVKEKKGDNNAFRDGDIITVMEKISNTKKISDWKFSIYSLSDKKYLTDEFKKKMPVSCTDCHERYSRDYVSDTFYKIRNGR